MMHEVKTLINFKTTIAGSLLTLTHPKAIIEARKQGFMTFVRVFVVGKTVYSKHIHRDKAPELILELARSYMK